MFGFCARLFFQVFTRVFQKFVYNNKRRGGKSVHFKKKQLQLEEKLEKKRFRLMKKLLFLLLFSIFALPRASAQETCNLSISEAPTFFGLRLEMTPAQVKSVFGKSLKLKIKREGTFFQNFIDKPQPAFLPDVRALYLRFFDRKLYQIEIFYEDRDEQQTAAQFVNVLSENLNLPVKFWENKYEKYKLNCAKFSLVADRVLSPHVELTDEATRTRFEEAQKSKKQ
jgi:hypothetical protein